jgi:hypothetical protein
VTPTPSLLPTVQDANWHKFSRKRVNS